MHIKLMVEVRTEDNYYVYGEDKESKGCFGCRGGYPFEVVVKLNRLERVLEK